MVGILIVEFAGHSRGHSLGIRGHSGVFPGHLRFQGLLGVVFHISFGTLGATCAGGKLPFYNIK